MRPIRVVSESVFRRRFMSLTHQPAFFEGSLPIRVEAVLAMYPLHSLTKSGKISPIRIERWNQEGQLELLWQVSPSEGYGSPGILSYQLDNLVINRRIYESGKPVPPILKLGSLRELCDELGMEASGQNAALIKQALARNAGATITCKLSYRTHDGKESELEQVFSRYSVIFTGKKLPNGEKADGVYVLLNSIYHHFLSEVMFRHLDVGYMKSLGQPSAQRWYEWVSYRMHGAIGQGKAQVTVRYSEFCECAPLKRQFKDKSFYNQMGAIHKPHLKSGYLSKVEFTKITDSRGLRDWLIHYSAGIRARNEYHLSRRREAARNEEQAKCGMTVKGLLSGETGTTNPCVEPGGVANYKCDRRKNRRAEK
jgi:hypothetical protein